MLSNTGEDLPAYLPNTKNFTLMTGHFQEAVTSKE